MSSEQEQKNACWLRCTSHITSSSPHRPKFASAIGVASLHFEWHCLKYFK